MRTVKRISLVIVGVVLAHACLGVLAGVWWFVGPESPRNFYGSSLKTGNESLTKFEQLDLGGARRELHIVLDKQELKIRYVLEFPNRELMIRSVLDEFRTRDDAISLVRLMLGSINVCGGIGCGFTNDSDTIAFDKPALAISSSRFRVEVAADALRVLSESVEIRVGSPGVNYLADETIAIRSTTPVRVSSKAAGKSIYPSDQDATQAIFHRKDSRAGQGEFRTFTIEKRSGLGLGERLAYLGGLNIPYFWPLLLLLGITPYLLVVRLMNKVRSYPDSYSVPYAENLYRIVLVLLLINVVQALGQTALLVFDLVPYYLGPLIGELSGQPEVIGFQNDGTLLVAYVAALSMCLAASWRFTRSARDPFPEPTPPFPRPTPSSGRLRVGVLTAASAGLATIPVMIVSMRATPAVEPGLILVSVGFSALVGVSVMLVATGALGHLPGAPLAILPGIFATALACWSSTSLNNPSDVNWAIRTLYLFGIMGVSLMLLTIGVTLVRIATMNLSVRRRKIAYSIAAAAASITVAVVAERLVRQLSSQTNNMDLRAFLEFALDDLTAPAWILVAGSLILVVQRLATSAVRARYPWDVRQAGIVLCLLTLYWPYSWAYIPVQLLIAWLLLALFLFPVKQMHAAQVAGDGPAMSFTYLPDVLRLAQVRRNRQELHRVATLDGTAIRACDDEISSLATSLGARHRDTPKHIISRSASYADLWRLGVFGACLGALAGIPWNIDLLEDTLSHGSPAYYWESSFPVLLELDELFGELSVWGLSGFCLCFFLPFIRGGTAPAKSFWFSLVLFLPPFALELIWNDTAGIRSALLYGSNLLVFSIVLGAGIDYYLVRRLGGGIVDVLEIRSIRGITSTATIAGALLLAFATAVLTFLSTSAGNVVGEVIKKSPPPAEVTKPQQRG